MLRTRIVYSGVPFGSYSDLNIRHFYDKINVIICTRSLFAETIPYKVGIFFQNLRQKILSNKILLLQVKYHLGVVSNYQVQVFAVHI